MIPTLCISLGGSRFEIGLFDSRLGYRGGGLVEWRSRLNTQSPNGLPTAQDFVALLANAAHDLLSVNRQSQLHALNVGIAFPGPQVDGLWYSNNLTADFRRGIRLEQIIRDAMVVACEPTRVLEVIAVLDAQADAGGEIFHPEGSLRAMPPNQGACVLNVATGVAAGFVIAPAQPSEPPFVLRNAEEFFLLTDGAYDSNAGHLGRHLVLDRNGQTWNYLYASDGALVSESAGIRLSDVISGPALAARLAQHLLKNGLGAELTGNKHLEWLLTEAGRIFDGQMDELQALRDLVDCVRKSEKPVSREVLDWLDRSIVDTSIGAGTRMLLSEFRDNVSIDFGRALACWQNAVGWKRFKHKIVLTGGVGQKAFVRTNAAFIALFRSCLLADTEVVRSILEGGCERSAWFFHFGVFYKPNDMRTAFNGSD